MNTHPRLLSILLVGTLLIILAAGLYPKDLRPGQTIQVTETGLQGARYTVAETGHFLTSNVLESLNDNGFAIDLSLTMPGEIPDRFMVLSAITSGSDETQFLIGQWRETLIVMTGNDYANRAREPRLYINTTELGVDETNRALNITFRFSTSGVEALVDNQQIAFNPDFIIELETAESRRITFANTPERSHGWPGEIQRFVLSATTQSSGEPLADYRMSQESFAVTPPHPDAAVTLPPNYLVSEPCFYKSSGAYFSHGTRSALDILLNIAGFIPFGLLVFFWLKARHGQTGAASALLLSVLAGLLVSLLIEWLQGYLASRDSTIYDVGFNTLGTACGALLGCCIYLLRVKQTETEKTGTDVTPTDVTPTDITPTDVQPTKLPPSDS